MGYPKIFLYKASDLVESQLPTHNCNSPRPEDQSFISMYVMCCRTGEMEGGGPASNIPNIPNFNFRQTIPNPMHTRYDVVYTLEWICEKLVRMEQRLEDARDWNNLDLDFIEWLEVAIDWWQVLLNRLETKEDLTLGQDSIVAEP